MEHQSWNGSSRRRREGGKGRRELPRRKSKKRGKERKEPVALEGDLLGAKEKGGFLARTSVTSSPTTALEKEGRRGQGE